MSAYLIGESKILWACLVDGRKMTYHKTWAVYVAIFRDASQGRLSPLPFFRITVELWVEMVGIAGKSQACHTCRQRRLRVRDPLMC